MTDPTVSDAPLSAAATLSGAFAAACTAPSSAEAERSSPRSLFVHWVVRSLDTLLRRALGVREFTDRPDCMLRAAITRAPDDLLLADGAAIMRGDPIIDLHLWNEQLPNEGSLALGRANELRRRMLVSFRELAQHLDSEPSVAQIVAVRGRIVCIAETQLEGFRRFAGPFGFDVVLPAGRISFLRKVHDFFERLLIWMLAWTFNPGALRRRGVQRCEVWISRDALIARYGRTAPSFRNAGVRAGRVQNSTAAIDMARPYRRGVVGVRSQRRG